MGTNYYIGSHCEHCGHIHDKIHLGKSSMGWTFGFRGDQEKGVIDYKSWRSKITKLLADGMVIVNEYGERTELQELEKLIKEKKKSKYNHSKKYPGPNNWVDKYGNSFSDYEFS